MSGIQLSLFGEPSENSENYFNRKRSWSASKHRLMLRYIQSFCYNLGGNKPYQSLTLNYVDGFAGTGKYDEGIGIKNFVDKSQFWQKYNSDFSDTDGSPLIALKCAKIFSLEERVNLRCFFTEANNSFNKKLRENCQSIGKGLSYKIYEPQNFADALPEIINDLDNYPTLFFLDTFGVKGVTFEQICFIGNYLSQYKGELFLLFHNIPVARHAGQSTANSDNPQSLKAAATYTKNLTALLGPNSEQDWKQKWIELKDKPQQFERWALDFFKNRILKESSFKGVSSFEIKEMYNDVRPQYSIVVCSNHPQKAFGAFLNEFIWEESKLLFFKENKIENIQKFLEREWEQENRERIAKIKPEIVKILGQINQNWLPLADVITRLILEIGNLGYLKRTQYYNDILLPLISERVIEVKDLGAKGKVTLKSQVKIVQ